MILAFRLFLVGLVLFTAWSVACALSTSADQLIAFRGLQGVVPCSGGRVMFDGVDITSFNSSRRVANGMMLVPEGRQVFPQV